MKKIFCAVALAAALSISNTTRAMRDGHNHDHGYVGPVLSGMVAGWAYERILHRMPILLGLPMAGIAAFVHTLYASGYHTQDERTAMGVSALATALVLYAVENDTKQKVIIEHHRRQDFVVHERLYQPRPGHHHHHAGCSDSH